MPDRLAEYLTLVDDILAAGTGVATEGAALAAAGHRSLTRRECVLAALARKILSAGRAMRDDCGLERGEAMHHLKTMAEAFMCFQVVSLDEGEDSALRLLNHIVDERLSFLKFNPAWDGG